MNHGSFDEYAKRLTKIDWFANVGKPSKEYEAAATDWATAAEMVDSDDFGNQRMNAQNVLSNYLSRHNIEEDRLWNGVVELAWEKIDAEKEKVLKAITSADVQEKVWKRCRVHLGMALLEAWYSHTAPVEYCFGRLTFAVFEAGRLPVGYTGRTPSREYVLPDDYALELPDGKFQVY